MSHWGNICDKLRVMIYQKQFWNVDVDVETIHLTLECGGDHHHHFGPNYSGILLGQIQCIFGLYRTLLINIWHSNQLNSTLRDMWDFSRIGGMHKLIQHTTFICCLFLLSSAVCPENALMQLIAMRTEPNYPAVCPVTPQSYIRCRNYLLSAHSRAADTHVIGATGVGLAANYQLM